MYAIAPTPAIISVGFWPVIIRDRAPEDANAKAWSHARARLYFALIETYFYPAGRIEFDVAIPGLPDSRVSDLVAYRDANHQEPYLAAICMPGDAAQDARDEARKLVLEEARALGAGYAVVACGATVAAYRADGTPVSGIPGWKA